MAERPQAFPWNATASALSVTIRLTPRGGRDALDGIETLSDGRAVLKARVRAAPTSAADLTFAPGQPRVRNANVKSKAALESNTC